MRRRIARLSELSGAVAKLEDLHHLRYHHVEVDFTGDVPAEAVRAAAGVDQVAVDGRHLTCTVRGEFGPLLAALDRSEVSNLVSQEPSLEEIFLTYYQGDTSEMAAMGAAGTGSDER